VFDGPVVISGTVGGDVTVFNGQLSLTSTARVGGDLVTRTAPDVAPGATVGGLVRRLSDRNFEFKFGFASRMVVWIAVSVSVFLLGLFLVLFAPRAAEAVSETGRSKIGPSIGIGFAVFFGFPIAAIIALVTLVGIPLGLGMLLAVALLYWVGYTWSAWFLGRLVLRPPRSRLLAFLLGLVVLRAIALVPILGGITWLFAAVFGLGMMTVAAFRASHHPVPALPPAPEPLPAPAPPAEPTAPAAPAAE
jgi:hypothetical protein